MNTYSALKTSVLRAIKREDDDDLNAQFDTFPGFIEQDVNALGNLVQMETRTKKPLTEDVWQYRWPDDYKGLRSMRVISADGYQQNTEMVSPEQFNAAYDKLCNSVTSTGIARTPVHTEWIYVVHNDVFVIGPTPTGDGNYVEIVYYADVPPLNQVNPETSQLRTTNWLLTKFNQIYYYGLLMHCELHSRNSEKAALMEKYYLQGLTKLEKMSQNQTFSGSTVRIRTRGSR